jgi:hypothetical protein
LEGIRSSLKTKGDGTSDSLKTVKLMSDDIESQETFRDLENDFREANHVGGGPIEGCNLDGTGKSLLKSHDKLSCEGFYVLGSGV